MVNEAKLSPERPEAKRFGKPKKRISAPCRKYVWKNQRTLRLLQILQLGTMIVA
jgi:hypothetical protein